MIIGTIDPGHGGNSRWNIGANGYVEADAMLLLSKIEKEEFESTGRFLIHLTRDSDVTISLNSRAMKAVSTHSDFLISNHSDAGPAATGGTTVYYSIDLPSDRPLAEKLASAISGTLGIYNRGARFKESSNYPGEDYYGVIDYAQDKGVPHIFLVEHAFHTNPSEVAKLNNIDYLRSIATAKVGVICDYYGVPYPSGAKDGSYKIKSGVVTATVLNCREKPSILSKINGKLKKGSVVTIYDDKNGWYLVNNQTPQWVNDGYVRIV